MADQHTPPAAAGKAAKKTGAKIEGPKAPAVKVGDTVNVVVAREPGVVDAKVTKAGPGNFADLEFEFEDETVVLTKSPFAPFTPDEPGFKPVRDSWHVEAQ